MIGLGAFTAILIFCVFHKWFPKLKDKFCLFCISFWIAFIISGLHFYLFAYNFLSSDILFMIKSYWKYLFMPFEITTYSIVFYFFIKTTFS